MERSPIIASTQTLMEPGRMVNVERIEHAWVITLHLPARLEPDAFSQVHRVLIEEWQPESGALCVIDLADVQYLGSILLGLLINIRTRVHATGGRAVLCGMPTRLLHVVRTTSLERLFDIYASRDDALWVG